MKTVIRRIVACFLVITMLFTINIVVNAAPTTLFTDGFESNNFTSGSWTNSGCDIQTTNKYAGTRAARFNSSDILTKTFSTVNYQSIQVSYARMTSACETDDHFICEWYNGSSWATLEDLTGNSSWSVKTWTLPSTANNKSSIQVRFKTTHNGSSDYAYLDEVKIIGTVIPDTQAPTAPGNLTCTSKTDTSASFSWTASTDNTGVTGYDIYNGSTKVGSTTTALTYTATGLTQGTNYTFSVKAKDAASNISLPSTINVLTVDTQLPTAPLDLFVLSKTDSSVTLTWSASSDNVGVTGYDIYNGSSKIGSTTTDLFYNITGLTQGTNYTFSVKAIDASLNESAGSNISVSTIDTEGPTIPSNLLVVSKTATSVTLSWTPSSDNVGVAGYDVLCDGNAGGTTSGDTTITITGLTQATSYTFLVKARDAAGNLSQDSNLATVVTNDTQAPTAPSNLHSAPDTQTSIILNWSPSSDNTSVVGYDVFNNGNLIGSTTELTYLVSNLSIGTTSNFTVKAKDAEGNISPDSNICQVTIEAPDTDAPLSPTELQVVSKTDTSISISWTASTDNIGVDSYDIYSGSALVGTTQETIYTISDLLASTEYTFTIIAKDQAGNSSTPSDVLTVVTEADPSGLQPPQNLVVIASGLSFSLSWGNVIGATGYEVYRNNEVIASTENNSYTDQNIDANTEYIYYITAQNGEGQKSAPSNSVTVNTNDNTPPSVPSNLRVVTKTETSAVIAWDPSTDDVALAGYDIYMDGTLAGSVTSDITQYNVEIIEQGRYYIVTVKARDQKGNEAESSNSLQIIDCTHISGYISQNTTWPLNNSPYILDRTITINNGVRLTIEPGVVIKGNFGSKVIVNGVINTIGTNEQPIVLTSINDIEYGGVGVTQYTEYWGGVRVNSSGEMNSEYIKIKYVDSDSYNLRSSSLYVEGKLCLNNSEITDSRMQGILLDTSKDVVIMNSKIIKANIYGIAIIGTSAGTIIIENNVISNVSSDAVYINHYGSGSIIFRNNTLEGNVNGITINGLHQADIMITGNTITNNSNAAININLNNVRCQLFSNILNNIITGNGVNGIELKGSLTTNLNLPKSASPYVIGEPVIVGTGATLTIEPGVIVKGRSYGSVIEVNGLMNAIGTHENPIIFTSLKDNEYGGSGVNQYLDYWGGIRVKSIGEFYGDCVILKYGYDVSLNGTSLYAEGKLTLLNSSVNSSWSQAIRLNNPQHTLIKNSIIDQSGYGIFIINGTGNITVEGSKITNTDTGLYIFHKGIGDLQIKNNGITNNKIGISVQQYENGGLNISGNTIKNSNTYAFEVRMDWIKDSVFSNISNNMLFDNRINDITLFGVVRSDVTLTECASPFRLIGSINIISGVTLNIEPGVVLRGDYLSSLQVDGVLSALGSKDKPITFTSLNDSQFGGSGITGYQDYIRTITVNANGEFIGDNVKIRYTTQSISGKYTLINSEVTNYYIIGIVFNSIYQPTLIANSFSSYRQGAHAVYNDNSTQIINAEYNYWGSPYGPSKSFGSLVSTGVDYIPYLGEEIKIQTSFGKPGTNAATGNFSRTYTDTDMSVPGFKLNISRTYNSGDEREDSVLGKGWTFGFQGSIKSYGIDNTLKVVRLPNGGAQSFKQNTDGTFTANDSRSTLVQQADGSYILTTQDQYSYGFGSDGYLKWMNDRNGNTITINTDADGRVLSIIDPVGRQFTINYDASKKITSIVGPMDRTVTYGYENDRLTSVTDPSGRVTTYTYTSYTIGDKTKWLLTGIRDHENNLVESVTYFSDESNGGKVATTTDKYGNTQTYSYDNGGRKTTITDTNGRQTTKWYDTSFNITNTKDAEEKYTAIEYFTDADGNNLYGEQKSTTDRNGNKTQFERDTRGNVTKIINPDSSYKQFTYDEKNNLISERDEMGKYTYYVYDSNKIRLIKKAQPLNGTDVYTLGCDESKFAITTFTYYEEGESGYTIKGLLKSVTDPEGNVTTYTYDENGNTKTVSDPETGKVTTFEYNAVGWKTAEVSPRGFRTEYYYDKAANVVKVIKNATSTTKSIYRTVYDALGRKVQEISPNQYDLTKDGLDLVTGVNTYNDPNAGNRYGYFENGTLEFVTDPENNTTSFTYDLYGNILTETKPNGAVYVYEYDVMNRMTKKFFKEDSTSAPKLLEEYQYAILVDKTTTTTLTKYLTETQTAVTTITNDYAGREIKRLNPDQTQVVTSYNPNGTVASVKNVNGGTTYNKYDGQNRLSEQWIPFEQTGSQYSYKKITYDRAGRQKTIQLGKQLVSLYALPSTFSETVYDYYKNGKVKAVYENNRMKTEYQYDDDRNVIEEKAYTSATAANVIQYTNDYNGKPLEKKVTARKGDLEGNVFTDDTMVILTTLYTYDLNGNLETMTTPNQVTTTYEYDNLSRQTAVSQPGIDEYGIECTIRNSQTYNWEGKVLSSTDANLNVTNYIYNKRGFLEKVTDPKGGTAAFYYDLAGRKIAEVSPESYDPNKTLDQMSRVTYVYDKMDRVITKTFEGMEKTFNPATGQWAEQAVSIVQKAYQYDSSGNVTKELDALGYEAGTGDVAGKISTGYGTTTTYNLANLVSKVCDPVNAQNGLSYTVSYTYNGLGQKVTETNANGAVTVYEYDNDGNITKIDVKANVSAAAKTVKQATYDYLGNAVTVTDGNGNVTTYEYNAFNKARKTIYPGDASIDANSLIYQYNVMGDLVSQQDSIGRIDTYTYDNQGKVLSHTTRNQDSTKSITTSTKFDKNGNKRFEKDGNGNTVEFRYNSLNQLTDTDITVSGVLHNTHYTYDKNGNQTSIRDWRANTSLLEYDALNRLILKSDANGVGIQKLVYNHNNVQIRSYDALNYETQFAYDRNNRLLSTIDPEGHKTSQTYDNVGNIKTKVDGKNNTTTYFYDEFNRLTKVTNAKNENTSYSYDLNGNMLSQTDGRNNVQYFEYNVANKLIRKVDAGGRSGSPGSYGYDPARTESYTYYADGNLKTKIDRNGKTTTYSYDIFGRLTNQSIESISISYTYDGNSNMLTMEDSTGTTTRTYDALNRVKTKSVPNIGTTNFTYDITQGIADGCYAERTTDPKGNIVLKVYDKIGRLKEVTSGGDTTSYEYYDNGNRKSVVYGSGLREDYTYYKDNLLFTLINKKADGSTIDSYTYTYDAAHNQLTKVDKKGTTSYTYDVLNRLGTVSEPSRRALTYTYDAAGNRATETIVVGTQTTVNTYTYNEQNRLSGIVTTVNGVQNKTTSYTYDNNGNQLVTTVNGASQLTNTYNALNQLIQSVNSSGTMTYKYNAEGYRVEKSVDGTMTRYLYEADKVVLEVNSSGAQIGYNVYGLNLVKRNVSGVTYRYLYNGHADVTALIASDGSIAATYYYDAFGTVLEQTGSVNNTITYAGYQFDKETGLYYLNARYYDSITARFLSEDTFRGNIIDPLSLNLYTYCSQNPIKYKDPSGHWQEGDEEYPPEVQAELMALSCAWLDASTQSEKQKISDEAKKLRSMYSRNAENNTDDAPASKDFKRMINEGKADGKYLTKEEWFNAFTNGAKGKYSKETNLISFDDGMVKDSYGTITYTASVKGYTNTITSEKLLYGSIGKVAFGWTVTDILYINDMDDLPVFGHSALLMKRADGSAMYYSYMSYAPNSVEDGAKYGGGIPNEGFIGKKYLSAADMNQFMSDGKISDHGLSGSSYHYNKNEQKFTISNCDEVQGYDRFIQIPVTLDQSINIIKKAEEIFWEKGDSYMLYENNCTFVAQQILEAGGLNFTPTHGDTNEFYGSVFDMLRKDQLGFIFAYLQKFKDNGTIPNGAFETGAKIAKAKGWTTGTFK